MTVSFTGHRTADMAAIGDKLYDTVLELAESGADTFCTGGALGFDTLAAEAVLRVKSRMPWITLKLVLPCPPDEQTRSFSREMKEQYFDILMSADSTEYISPFYTDSCMKERNMRLIELADVCVCWYDSRRSVSGTGQTVRMAQRKGIKIINLFSE